MNMSFLRCYYAIEEENIFLKFKSNFISSEFVRELLACYNSEPQNFFCQKLHFFTAAAESEEPCANFIFAKFKHIFTLLFLQNKTFPAYLDKYMGCQIQIGQRIRSRLSWSFVLQQYKYKHLFIAQFHQQYELSQIEQMLQSPVLIQV